MGAFIAKRTLSILPTLLIVGIVGFLLVHLTPGDAATYILGSEATVEQIDALRATLGLDKPLVIQFGHWFLDLVRLDLGTSITENKPVVEIIGSRMEPTVMLALAGLVFSCTIGVLLGVYAATKRGSLFDQFVMLLATLGVAVPTFWLGINLVILFAVKWQLFPVAGYSPLSDGLGQNLYYLFLPGLALGLAEASLIARMARSTMLEVLNEDYVRTARAKGLPHRVVVFKHAFRNAALPLVTTVAISAARVLGNTVVIENVFNVPGLGRMLMTGILRRDYPLVQSTVIFIALAYLLINLVVDLSYALIDPRIRYA